MSSIPSNLARVPTLLISQVSLGSLTRTQQMLLHEQVRLSSGKRVNRPSDDAVATSTISVLDDIIERRQQRLRNLSHAEAVLNNVDSALGDVSSLIQEAKVIGLSQIGAGSDAQTRRSQAHVIDSLLREMIAIGNRRYQQIHLFGGNATAHEPLISLLNGVQYAGQGAGLATDLGIGGDIPITIAGTDAFGSLSTRVEGDRDLDPRMLLSTRLSDLRGARGQGVALGSINVDVNGVDLTVDLTGAHTIGDVISTLQAAIAAEDPAAVVDIDPATGHSLRITPGAGVTITISDASTLGTAADLGIDLTFPPATATSGGDLNPRLTPNTPISALSGVTVPLGTIRIINAGQTRDVDLSTAQTIGDIINAVQGQNLGVRVEVDSLNDRLNFVNELSGGRMSIAEAAGGTTATELGVRSLTTSTLLSDFNSGLGVEILSGGIDPQTGLPDPAADRDFRITLHDGTSFDIDLAIPGVALTVQDVLDAINAAAAGAGLGVPADFLATLASDGNGIALIDNTSGFPGSALAVTALNGSHAAGDLGILGSTGGATLTGTDRATVAVESVFSHLMALRDALLSNDERGISLATGKLDADLERAASARAAVGVRTQRVAAGTLREEELVIQDTALKSQVQDLDFTEAAVRFTQLQQQLQAGLATAARVTTMSLLDFLR